MTALKDMATFAAKNHLKGKSFKRNSILKPFDIIMDSLESEPKPEFREMVRDASEDEIFNHIDRVASPNYKPGQGKRDQIEAYIKLFFEGLLVEMYENDVNRLLRHKKLLRGAYLISYRKALAPDEKVQADTEQDKDAQQQNSDNEE